MGFMEDSVLQLLMTPWTTDRTTFRLWIMLRDEIDYNEFCRRGQKQQKSSEACAGMPDTGHGAKQSPAD
jgi:hypothetical protein